MNNSCIHIICKGGIEVKNRTKVIWVISSMLIVILVVTISYYLMFSSPNVYNFNRTTNTVENHGVEYVLSKSLPSDFLDKREKTIGKIKGSNSTSAERWVVKIKGVDGDEMFLVTGLMNQDLFIREDKVEAFNKTLPQ
jgi:hypothetical protein